MAKIVPGRKTIQRDEGIVVFIIGARINKWWLLPFSIPVLGRMRAMLEELAADPSSDLLAVQSFGFGCSIQYWRSLEGLMSYAEDRNKAHQPAAKRYFQKLFKNQAAGIWHETYVVPGGHYECIYNNMPRMGLGKVSPLLEASGELSHARKRLSAAAYESAPGA